MLQVARLGPKHLGEASEKVEGFYRSRLNPDGGFQDRAGASDLYYTVFGIEGLTALQAEVPSDAITTYLEIFGDGEGLDFVHLACLGRAWAAMPSAPASKRSILERIELHRTPDGGYAAEPGRRRGSAYHAFLALGAYQDLGGELPHARRLAESIESLRAKDGGYANQEGGALGLTTTTAAAVAALRQLGWEPDPELAPWLLARFHEQGGFVASPATPMPDLLSTATALHALAALHADVSTIKEPCLDFLDTLWSSEGGFYGHWADDALDCEYTYYGLLALGHLSL
jgi:hypothetical protein